MLSLLGDYHCLTILHTAKCFICLNETKKSINEFAIGYKTNPGLHINKAFIYQVEKYMHTTFGECKKHLIKATLSKKYKCVRIDNVS